MNIPHVFGLGFLLLTTACSSVGSILIDSGYRVAQGDAPKATKIFLIAGSRDTANFAQEVVDQKKFWLAQGYKSEEISCYYVPPPKVNSYDEKQFEDLLRATRDCFLADPRTVLSHIRSAAAANPDAVYVYITSHGNKPYRQRTFTYKTDADREKFEKIFALPGWGDTYLMTLEGFYHEGSLAIGMYDDGYKLATYALQNPNRADDYLLTPRGLRSALSALPAQTKKFVVLQGCHTGGFILPAKKVGAANTLSELPNTTVLTASSNDRTSFGCDVGSHTTYFGESFQHSLQKYGAGRKVSDIDWKLIYNATQHEVQRKEAKLVNSKFDFSRPQYHIN